MSVYSPMSSTSTVCFIQPFFSTSGTFPSNTSLHLKSSHPKARTALCASLASPPPPRPPSLPPPLPPPQSPPPRRTTGATFTAVVFVALVAAALLHAPLPILAKNLMTGNTIFRRYLVTDSSAILRYSLTLPNERANDPDPAPIRLVQECLERLGVHLRSRGVAGLIASRRDVAQLGQLLSQRQLDILLDVPAKKRQEVAEKITALENSVGAINEELGSSPPIIGERFLPPDVVRIQQTLRDAFTPRNTLQRSTNFDVPYVESLRGEALDRVSEIEEIAVEGSGPAFRIPRRYNSLPRLLGRAQVSLRLHKQSGEWVNEKNEPLGSDAKLTIVLDGYSAPITAGNFMDLVKQKYYDGTRVLSIQRGFYAQLGEREDDKVEGFVDPKTKIRRQIPLEILVQGESMPAYGATLDELGIADLQPALPVSAFGATAMVHTVENPNDASSQFYFFMLDPTSYQARSVGGTILTGSVATFGYVIDGKQFLPQMKDGDRIVSASVISGDDNFRKTGDS